jgi:hypothetical protein
MTWRIIFSFKKKIEIYIFNVNLDINMVKSKSNKLIVETVKKKISYSKNILFNQLKWAILKCNLIGLKECSGI